MPVATQDDSRAILQPGEPAEPGTCTNCGAKYPPRLGKRHCSEQCRKQYSAMGGIGAKQRKLVYSLIDERLKQYGILPGAK